MYTCPACGGNDVQTDPFSNNVMCSNPMCYALIEENRIVSEVGYTENKDGTVATSGQKVSWEANNGFAKGEAREVTISRGHRILESIASGLHLKTHLIEQGKRIFLLAVQRNFTKGRQTKLVSAACLYILCRRDRSPHLLVDFSDILQTSVKKIGQVYMKLVRLLNFDNVVDVPLVDPSLFMERFATKLSLPSNQAVHEVTQTAIRFVQAMNRDWICTGRRPTGLCGAALLLASRYHGHRIPANEISKVVRMGECTLKRRLFELRQTPLALMDRQQFELADFTKPTQECFPPAMVTNVHRELQAIEGAKARAALMDESRSSDVQSRVSGSGAPLPALEDGSVGEIEGDDRERERERRDREREVAAPPTPSTASNATASNATASSPRSRVKASPSPSPNAYHDFADGVNLEGTDSKNLETIVQQMETAIKPDERPKSDFILPDSTIDPMDPLFEDENENNEEDVAVVESRGELAEEQWETLSDVLSEDIDLCAILTEEEQAAKREVWNEVNKDYLEEMHHRERQKRRKKLEGGCEKRRKGIPKTFKADTVEEASRLVLNSNAKSVVREMTDSVLEQLFS